METRPVIPLWPPDMPGIDLSAEETQNVPDRFRNIRNPTITVCEPDPSQRCGAGVVICPGGGYGMVSCANEGWPVAEWLNSLGVCAYVLKYRLPATEGVDYCHPVPLADAQRALRMVRASATERGLGVDRIGIAGFSAGGHLAATASTLFDHPVDAGNISCRPDFSILIYPVMTFMDPGTCHSGSRANLMGPRDSPQLREQLSPERHVTENTPPAFLAHAKNDGAVPYRNSVLYHEALQKQGISSELHLYEQGQHGFGLGTPEQDASQWPDEAARWLRTLE